MPVEKTLAELSEESGIPARTIRFYIARGLLGGPAKSGRGAVYHAGHLAGLARIQTLQTEGRTLGEIVTMLQPQQDGPASVTQPPVAWWQYNISPDVYVMARADMSPWRIKQVRAAVQKLAALMEQGSDE